jgi:hypothetical protein
MKRGAARTSVGCALFCQVLYLCLHKEDIGSNGILLGYSFKQDYTGTSPSGHFDTTK